MLLHCYSPCIFHLILSSPIVFYGTIYIPNALCITCDHKLYLRMICADMIWQETLSDSRWIDGSNAIKANNFISFFRSFLYCQKSHPNLLWPSNSNTAVTTALPPKPKCELSPRVVSGHHEWWIGQIRLSHTKQLTGCSHTRLDIYLLDSSSQRLKTAPAPLDPEAIERSRPPDFILHTKERYGALIVRFLLLQFSESI